MRVYKLLSSAFLLSLLVTGLLAGQGSSPTSAAPASSDLQSARSGQSAPSDQQASEVTPGPGGFETSGSVDFGYRFTDIKGAQQGFLQLFDLRKGPRLMEFHFSGRAAAGSAPFADTFSLDASGLGGDPFPSVQLNVGKTNLYDLRVNW